jgi:hypothetical protein
MFLDTHKFAAESQQNQAKASEQSEPMLLYKS